jgi:integrase
MLKLTATQAKAASEPGRYSDGGGLYLNITSGGSKSWTYIWSRNGRRREMGLGAYSVVSLADARELAEECRQTVRKGMDPINERKKTDEPFFIECIEQFLAAKESGWKNEKHRYQWRSTLMTYAKPLHGMRVSEISTPDVLQVLKPIWLNKHETASRLRGRIEAVLDYAKAMGWRNGENPALWRGNLKSLLPSWNKSQKVVHLAAIDMDDLPQFMRDLRDREAVAARLLEFIILTACRSGEARGAKLKEFDLAKSIWTIPAERMKMGKEHTIPLSDRALDIVRALSSTAISDHLFTHPSGLKPYSVNATMALLRRMGRRDITTHGFRSTFRDWAGDRTNFQRETIEAALAHGLKDKVEAAYRRSSAIEKRKALMQAWADFCELNHAEKVIPIHRSH